MVQHPMKERLDMAVSWVEGILDDTGKPQTPKNVVWQVLANLLDGVMSPKYIYQIFKADRWKMCSDLAACLGFVLEENLLDSDSSLENSEQIDEHQQLELLPRCILSVNIPPEKWSTIKPVLKQHHRADRSSKQRNVLKLVPNVWTYEVAALIDGQHGFPCALAFKNSRVAVNPSLAKNYVTMEVYCTECDNRGEGYILNAPLEGETAVLKLDLVDTRNVKHSKKRQCGGSERKRVGEATKDSSAAVVRRHDANKLAKKPGDPESPLLYASHVYRKVKQQAREKILNLPKSNNALLSLQEMKYDARFLGSIHDIGLDPIKVYYVTAGQILLHNSLQKQGYYSISLDATSSLIRRMTKVQGLSGHIFLYEFTCSTANGTAQLNQLLSEQQDANSILHWINDWSRRGALPPREVCVDDSAALLSALARSFGQCPDTKTYKHMCFNRLLNEQAPLPGCFLRLDLAHFISNISRWEVWKKESTNKMVKDHYMRFISLMIKEEDFQLLAETLSDLFTISLSATCGVTSEGLASSCQVSTNRLIGKVSGQPSVEDEIIVNKLEDIEEEEDTPPNIRAWVNEIKSKIVTEEGLTPNPYFSETIAKNIEKIAQSFVLWSAVMVPVFKSPFKTASSADVEGDFNDIKHRILRNESMPVKMQDFVALHLASIQGQTMILSTHAKKNEEMTQSDEDTHSSKETPKKHDSGRKRKNPTDSELEDEGSNDLRKIENWRNLASKDSTPSRIKKKKNYLEQFPEIQVAQEQLKIPKDVILRNGNLCRHVKFGDATQVKINNTCSFDSVIQVLTLQYLQNPIFRKCVLDMVELVPALKVVHSLATNGATADTYFLRAEALVPHAKLMHALEPRLRHEKKGKTKIEEYALIDWKDPLLDLQYSAYGNLRNLMEKVFLDFPSLTVKWSCESGHQGTVTKVLLDINMNTLIDEGIERLEFCLLQTAIEGNCYEERCNAAVQTVEEVGRHLFINTDMLMPPSTKSKYCRTYELSQIPVEIDYQGRQFTLAGLVAYKPNHYLGYGRTNVNKWELMDDTNRRIYSAKLQDIVLPHLLIYVL